MRPTSSHPPPPPPPRRSHFADAAARPDLVPVPLPPGLTGLLTMNATIESLEQRNLRTDVPRFKAGDTVRVHFKVIEGQRQRIQVFEGIVLKKQGAGSRESFTVRKQSFGVGVERTFPSVVARWRSPGQRGRCRGLQQVRER